MELLREEVYSEIAVLASLSRCGDTNDLAGTALKHQKVTNTDVVTRDGDGLRSPSPSLDITNILRHSFTDAGRTTLALLFLNDYLLTLVLGCERMENAVGCFLEAVTERVIVSLVVVVSHSWFAFFFENYFGFDAFFSRVMMRSTFKFNVVSRVNASAVFTLSDIDLFVTVGNLDVNVGTAVVTLSDIVSLTVGNFNVNVGTSVVTLSDIVSLTVGNFNVNIRTAVCVVVPTWNIRVSDAWRGLVMSGDVLTVPWRTLLLCDRDGCDVLWDGDLPLRKQ